jgi:hypothetical protein
MVARTACIFLALVGLCLSVGATENKDGLFKRRRALLQLVDADGGEGVSGEIRRTLSDGDGPDPTLRLIK